ncbi:MULTISPECIES: methylenetetrahydrofolate reductase [NAD(P)H] [Maricaulis]|jgi:methylenetetrahydrofolate reductase (NADPH)|uniref:Methylenetetrahydrofolate reductase n=1 Tax=Maricaulis maris (strain MCS10) TaxID=394221 RepID=Q0ALW3_MARMM|nr:MULTISPECIES: methylenetetrahydrofolate reductase [NAD(P)H] [Maricaulis]ABI66730.1 5,10-methylenetetrahydrofolate reductase [Maricaulis maris MCS10]MAC90584.1 methylenetetrahydrofolate reductase [NAD(P)H] [Maricaulis sp.]
MGEHGQAARKPDGLSVSFEFFPPKTDAMESTLWESISRLEPLRPDFVSVTYGAGGSTRDRTHRTVHRIVEETSIPPAAHLTCVNASKAEVDGVIRDYWKSGVRHIVALRGDPPDAIGGSYVPPAGGYANAAELARGISDIGDFEISVGCYPETHPESPNAGFDIDLLKAKIDAGATRAITQFFFDADVYFRFRDRARAAGITIPIVPGIMLQPNFKGLKRIAGLCGASLPKWLHEAYEGLDEDAGTRQLVTAHVAAKLCGKLRNGGVDGFHFYTLNRAELALSTCQLLGVKAGDRELQAVAS